MTYAYINSVLDAYPAVTHLAVSAAVYDVVTGPVPSGEQDITTRVAVERMPPDAVLGLCIGYDAADTIICQFFC